MTQMLLELSDKDFKTAVIKLLQQDLQTYLKQMGKKALSKNKQKEEEDIKKNEKEILELKNTITKIKTSIDGYNSTMKRKEEGNSELQDRTMKLPNVYRERINWKKKSTEPQASMRP